LKKSIKIFQLDGIPEKNVSEGYVLKEIATETILTNDLLNDDERAIDRSIEKYAEKGKMYIAFTIYEKI